MTLEFITVIENDTIQRMEAVENFPEEFRITTKKIFNNKGDVIGEKQVTIVKVKLYFFDKKMELTNDKEKAHKIELEFYDEDGEMVIHHTGFGAKQ